MAQENQSTTSPSQTQTVVVVGAGFAGVPAFNELSKRVDPQTTKLVLINPRSHFIHLPAACRLIVSPTEPNFEDKVLLPLTARFNEGNRRTVNGKVASITDKEGSRFVTLESGEVIEYTYLLLAPGSHWEGPLNFPETKEDTVKQLKEWHGKFENANDIVLVGGGGISFEYAGEILDEWPTKNVTIIHSKELLLNDVYPDSWRRDVVQSLEKRGVKLILGDRVDDIVPKDGKLTTRAGKTIAADLVIATRGPRPNTEFIASSFPDAVTPSGHVKAKPTLQLHEYPHIFVAGDVLDWDEQKSARKAFPHARVASRNILTLLADPNSTNLATYRGSYEALPLTNGRNGGTSYWGILWGLTFGDWFTRRAASRNLYIPGVNRMLNL